ncbi:MAG TPA: tripartite tricarboxylate transporter substrate binding protein [Thermodesulfobacteriota bacterium]
MTKPRVIALALAALGLAAVTDAPAADYPSRPIEVVVPYAPGGGTDNLMRTITGIMDENRISPVPLNVVNRAGGSGAVGYNYLVGKKGNDYVIAGATPTIVSGKIEGRVPGDHRDGMTILAIVAVDELTLAVRSDSKYQTIQQFLEAAKSQPNTLSVGGTSTNAEDHIFTYLMEKATGIKVKYVPFNSGGEVTAALLGGHIDAAVENPNEVQAQIEAGKARFLAVAAEKRMPDANQVPTFKELGYDVLWDQMRGVVGPADMSPEAVTWWQNALRKVSETERWQKGYIKRNLLTPVFMTGEEANAYLDQVREKYRKALIDMGAVKP